MDTNSLTDWLEANLLFEEQELAKSDVVDVLIEDQICPDNQDLAHSIASEGWQELKRRQNWGGLPQKTQVTTHRIVEELDWQKSPIRAFCLLLSLFRIYPDWASENRDSLSQGNLFERVVEIVCPALLPGWHTYRTGWSRDNQKDIRQIIESVQERIFTKGAADIDEWLTPSIKDGGLDILCYRTYEDEKDGLPTFFLQCASGKHWREKVGTPKPNLWQKWLNAAIQPSTGIVAPFVIDEKELRIAALEGQVVVFDRLRLLSAARQAKVKLPPDLRSELLEWMLPHVESIPRAD